MAEEAVLGLTPQLRVNYESVHIEPGVDDEACDEDEGVAPAQQRGEFLATLIWKLDGHCE